MSEDDVRDFSGLEEAWIDCMSRSEDDMKKVDLRVARDLFYAGAVAALELMSRDCHEQLVTDIKAFVAEPG